MDVYIAPLGEPCLCCVEVGPSVPIHWRSFLLWLLQCHCHVRVSKVVLVIVYRFIRTTRGYKEDKRDLVNMVTGTDIRDRRWLLIDIMSKTTDMGHSATQRLTAFRDT